MPQSCKKDLRGDSEIYDCKMLGYNQTKVPTCPKSAILGTFHLYRFCLLITSHYSTKFQQNP